MSESGPSRHFVALRNLAAIGAGCVKTPGAVADTKQKKRSCDIGESFVLERHSPRINVGPEQIAEWFSHGQDPKRIRGRTQDVLEWTRLR
jgi:hypothetical protein